MSVNDQHIVLTEAALAQLAQIEDNLKSALEVLSRYAPPKKDPTARQSTLLLNEIQNGIVTATVASGMLERTLRYVRIGAPETVENGKEDD